MKKINIEELFNYFIEHSEEETIKKFNISKCTLYRRLKKLGLKKSKSLIVERRKSTIKQDPTFWDKRNIKTKLTCLKKYGVESYTQTDSYKIKTKLSNQEKYGVDWGLQAESIKQKSIETNLKLYGIKNAGGAESTIIKIKNTKLQKYGDANYNNRKKISETWIQHSAENKHHYRCYTYNNIYFDSLPELAYYMYMRSIGVPIIRSTKKIEYFFENKKHIYLPDFEINDKIIEIKSNYLFKFMQQENTIENAKYKCMLENNVVLIRNTEYNKYIK